MDAAMGQREENQMSTTTTSTSSPSVAGATDRDVVVGTTADKALLLIRIVGGIAFLYHGASILFGAFGGPGPAGMAAMMKAPELVGVLVGLAQFCGGLALLTGVLARIGAACIVVVMLGAIFLVHLSHGYDLKNGGFEYAFAQLMIALAILIDGPGIYSLNRVLPAAVRKF
jgi:putative oxidoreductase